MVLVLAVTGIYLVLPGWVIPLVSAVARTEPRLRDPVSTPVAGGTPISPDRAVAIASAQIPGTAPSWLDISAEPTAVYRVWLRRPTDVRRVYGDAIVWIDQWSGTVLRIRERRALPAGDVILHWLFPLHSGEAFGLPGRLAVFATGLVPLILFVTGVLMRRRKRRVRRRSPRRPVDIAWS